MLDEINKRCLDNNSVSNIQFCNSNSTRIKFDVKNREIRIMVKISISDQILELTIDTGAQISILKPNKLHGNTRIAVHDKLKIMGIAKEAALFSIGRVTSSIFINEISFKHDFHIINNNFNLQSDGIIGNDFLIKYGALINYIDGSIQFNIPVDKEIIERQYEKNFDEEHMPSQNTSNKNNNFKEEKGQHDQNIDNKINDNIIEPSNEMKTDNAHREHCQPENKITNITNKYLNEPDNQMSKENSEKVEEYNLINFDEIRIIESPYLTGDYFIAPAPENLSDPFKIIKKENTNPLKDKENFKNFNLLKNDSILKENSTLNKKDIDPLNNKLNTIKKITVNNTFFDEYLKLNYYEDTTVALEPKIVYKKHKKVNNKNFYETLDMTQINMDKEINLTPIEISKDDNSLLNKVKIVNIDVFDNQGEEIIDSIKRAEYLMENLNLSSLNIEEKQKMNELCKN